MHSKEETKTKLLGKYNIRSFYTRHLIYTSCLLWLRYLEKNEMDEVEEEAGTVEPE